RVGAYLRCLRDGLSVRPLASGGSVRSLRRAPPFATVPGRFGFGPDRVIRKEQAPMRMRWMHYAFWKAMGLTAAIAAVAVLWSGAPAATSPFRPAAADSAAADTTRAPQPPPAPAPAPTP